MNLAGIVSVSGMPGLYKVVAQTKNGLIAESLADGKRLPIFSNDKVSSLEDISIYGNSADIPLKDVLGMIKEKLGATGIPSSKEDPKVMRAAFASCVTDFADDRVYTSDIKKVFVWYALLDAKGLLDAEPEAAAESKEEGTADKIPAKKPVAKQKDTVKAAAPKASTKGMAKTQTVRKTGG
jgi:hypothetical protein